MINLFYTMSTSNDITKIEQFIMLP